jgi:hypothetical protein
VANALYVKNKKPEPDGFRLFIFEAKSLGARARKVLGAGCSETR